MSAETASKTRWRFTYALDRLNRWCWADLVTWCLRWHGRDGVNRATRCIEESTTGRVRSCYCGKYENGALRCPSSEATS